MKSDSVELIEVASAVPTTSSRQLWLDVARPIQPRPRRAAAIRPERFGPDLPTSKAAQIEMRMEAPPALEPVTRTAIPRQREPVSDRTTSSAERSFASWLLDQVRRPGTLGELAKAAKLDRSYPKNGSADAVRARFSAAGADGDAFAALDDAEREFDRNGAE